MPLADGSRLHMTLAAERIDPENQELNGIGLTPDVRAGQGEDDIRSGRDLRLETTRRLLGACA
jgi:hypothetical protein